VKKVKIYEKSTLNVPVNQGVAKNGDMIRVDVFHVDGDGYYFVPIYVADTVKKELPCRAAVAHKPIEDWKAMDESNFLFSLYPGDLVHIGNNTPIKLKLATGAEGSPVLETRDSLLYYNGYDTYGGTLNLSTHDRRYGQRMGGKTLSLIEKYQVDVLGNYAPASLPEKRMGFR
jgi:CRISPR-associated endonuclease Csn1